MHDSYCFLCGNTSYPFAIDELLSDAIHGAFEKVISDRIKWIDYNNEWMRYCTILTINNEIFHNCEMSTHSSQFIPEKKNKVNTSLFNDPFGLLKPNEYNGIFLHTDCWKYISKKYGIKLKYSDLPIWKPKYGFVPFNINYGTISKYWSQYFNFKKMCIDGNHKLCESPLKSKKTALFINKIFKQLKIRDARSSPACSATMFDNGVYKLENNIIWQVINNKWIKYKLATKKSIKLGKKELHNIKFIAQASDTPKFIHISDKTYVLE
jgi:hypothetical protein